MSAGSNNSKSIFNIKVNIPLMFVILLALNLAGIINWSWWWIFSPIWVPIVLVVGVYVIFVMAIIIDALINM